MTGPAVSLRTRSQALRQTLAATSPITRTVQADAPWDEFTAYMNTSNPGYLGLGQSANLTPRQLAETQREIGQGLARLPLPLGAGAWSGLVTHLLMVAAGAGPRTFTGTPPQLELVYRNALSAHATVVAGSGAPVPVRPDWISLGLPAVAAVLLAAAALATEARRLSRHGVARTLRAE